MKINWSHLGEGLGAIGDAKMNSDAAALLNRKATYGQYTPDQADQMQASSALTDGPTTDADGNPTGNYYDAKQGWIGADGQPAQGLQTSNTFAGQTRDQPFSDDEVRSKNLQDTLDFWRSKGTFGKDMAKELQDAATSELHNKLVTGQIDQLGLEKQLKGQQVTEGDYRIDALKKAKDSQDKITDFMTRLYSTDPAVQKTALDEASAMHNGSDAIGGDSKSQVIQDPRTGANNLVYHPPTDQAGPPQVLSASDPNVLNTIRSEYIKNMLYQTKPEDMMKLDETAKQHAATIGVERDKLGLEKTKLEQQAPLTKAQADYYKAHGDYFANGGSAGKNSGLAQEKWDVARRDGFVKHLSNQIGFPDQLSGKNIVSPAGDALVNALMDNNTSESFIRDNVAQLRAKYNDPAKFEAAANEVLSDLRKHNSGGGIPTPAPAAAPAPAGGLQPQPKTATSSAPPAAPLAGTFADRQKAALGSQANVAAAKQSGQYQAMDTTYKRLLRANKPAEAAKVLGQMNDFIDAVR